MRVALFTDTFYPKIDGVVVSLTTTIERLAPAGYSFLVICPDYHLRIHYEFPEGTKILRMPSFPLPQYRDFRFVLPLLGRCVREVRLFGADVVHIHSYANLGFVGAGVARRLELPLVGTYHTLAAEFTRYLSPVTIFGIDRLLKHFPAIRPSLPRPRWNPLKSFIWSETVRLFNRCDAVVAPSRLTARELRGHGLYRPLYSISNGIELELFPPRPSRRGDAPQDGRRVRENGTVLPAGVELPNGPRLIHVGRISFEKRVDIVLLAFQRILRKIPNATLEIVGDGPALSAHRILASRLGVARSIHFAGFVPHGELAPFYHRSDLFVTASPMETQGVVLLEAMACGLPVIGIDRGAIPDLVQDGYNGYVVGMPHAASIAQRAVEILRSRDLLDRLGIGAVATAAEHDTAVTTARLSELYRKVRSGGAQKRAAYPE